MLHIREIRERLIISIFFIILMNGCGYAPSSKSAQIVMGNAVSVKIIISAINPQNTVIIKDAVNRAVIENFRTKLTSYADASTHLVVKLASVGYSPIQYNANGYVISYRMHTVLSVTITHQNITKTYKESGIYDFSIEPNAIISDQIRRAAINNSVSKAISAFVAQISAVGARKVKHDN